MSKTEPPDSSASVSGIYDSATVAAPACWFDPADPHQQHVNPETLFDGRALFSQIIVAPRGRAVWISGLIGCGPDNCLTAGGKKAQIEVAFVNLAAALVAAKCLPEHCVRLTEYVVDYRQEDLAPIRAQIRGLFVPGKLPTNVVVPVPRLGRDGALFELDAVCVRPDISGTDPT